MVEMVAVLLLAILSVAEPPEVLPVDAEIAALEAAIPRLRELQAEAERDIARLGPTEAGWATSGMSAAAILATAGGEASDHVLGEWEAGGHSVAVSGDHPLNVPAGWHRYAVRGYSGKIDSHSYYRVSPDIVIHTFGATTTVGNASCRQTQGVELISRDPWRSWSPENALLGFGMAQSTRDDPHTYCTLFRAGGGRRYFQHAYTPAGRPFLLVNENPQPFVVTSRGDATARIFSQGEPRE